MSTFAELGVARTLICASAVIVTSLACAGDRPSEDDGGEPTMTGIGSMSGSDSETGAGSADAPGDGDGDPTPGDGDGDPDPGDGDGDGDGIKLDTLPADTGETEGTGEEGCEKVDFLFVVDNSGSMTSYQQKLAQTFPTFISAITDELQIADFHIMSVDTDAAPVDCLDLCTQPNGSCNAANCGGLAAQEGCEVELGAGRTLNIDGVPCPIDGPQRYLVEGQTELASTFECVARQGGGNGIELQMQAMQNAVTPPLMSVGGCNEGFLRDDAILVVTVISDENDSSAGTPGQWYETIVAAKNGNPDAVVVLGILDGMPPNMSEFVGLWTHAAQISIELDDYAPAFLDVVSEIVTACEEFEPIG